MNFILQIPCGCSIAGETTCCVSEVTSHAAHANLLSRLLLETDTGATSFIHRRRGKGLAGVTSKVDTKRGTKGSSLDITASLEQLTKANSCMVSLVRPTYTFVRLPDSESNDVRMHKKCVCVRVLECELR